jgi:ribosomal protein S6--L-glutamate ligase
MSKTKKVAIYLPSYQKNSKKKGILSADEVKEIERMLTENKSIKYLGNVDLGKLKISGKKFICNGIDLAKIDLFFWYDLGVRKFLSDLKSFPGTVKVLKDLRSFEIVSDKFLAHSLLKKNGLPVADFALVDYNDLAKMQKLIKQWKTILIKPRLGNFGRGIIKVSDFETFRDIAGYLRMEHKQKKIFIERFYENEMDRWISTTIINGEAVYGYRKKKEKFAGWKVYDIKAKGGGAYYVDLAPVKKIAEKAAKLLDRSIVGFDFIKTREGYKIVDENNFPGFYPDAFTAAKKNVSQLIYDLIISHTSKIRR